MDWYSSGGLIPSLEPPAKTGCGCEVDYEEVRTLCDQEPRITEVVRSRSPYCTLHNPSAFWKN